MAADIAVSPSDAYGAGAGKFNMLLKIDATSGANEVAARCRRQLADRHAAGRLRIRRGHFVNVCQGGKCNAPRIHVA